MDENECFKQEINTIRANQINRINKINQQKNHITDLLCRNFALALLRYQDRLELRNIQEALQNAQAWNFGENESDFDKNSLDLYNSNDNIGTIAELADAIDRSLDNTTIYRTILTNQIKISTRAIWHKYANLQQDLIQIGGLNTPGKYCNKAEAEIGRIGAVEHLKQMAVFGQLMQGNMGVEEFSTRIKKVGKLARMAPEQQRKQFIRGLNPMNQYNIQMMAKFEDTQKNITRALAKAEKFTLSQRNAPSFLPVFLAANPHIDTNKSGMTKTKIMDLIKTAMISSESQMAQQNANLRSTIKSFQETISRVTKTLNNNKKLSKKRAVLIAF
ncbi:hypothetical protein C2G38_2032001 [Gigaspora rosea]|uniref:Uncharacterized protein n=1 Tax=Gigaspora rosea TaxID=44941 RepID=A0A397VP59_9GLOM|nr:hypothetical protein C2G38_2032001 [Gigaspora rosea]